MTRLSVSALAIIVSAMTLTLPATAEDYKVTGQFGWFAVGKATEIDKDHIYWTGEFSGTFFNDKGKDGLFNANGVKCPAFNDLNLGKKQSHAAGYCIIQGEASPNDQAFLKWSCEGDTVTCLGTFEYTGGSGKYQAASGNNTFKGVTITNWKDGNASGYATWNR